MQGFYTSKEPEEDEESLDYYSSLDEDSNIDVPLARKFSPEVLSQLPESITLDAAGNICHAFSWALGGVYVRLLDKDEQLLEGQQYDAVYQRKGDTCFGFTCFSHGFRTCSLMHNHNNGRWELVLDAFEKANSRAVVYSKDMFFHEATAQFVALALPTGDLIDWRCKTIYIYILISFYPLFYSII